MIIGIFLIIVGLCWFLSASGIISASIAQFFWPAIIIAVGIQLVWSYFKDSRNCCKGNDQQK